MFFRKKKKSNKQKIEILSNNIRIILITDRDIKKYYNLLYNNCNEEEINKKLQEDLKIDTYQNNKNDGFIIKFKYKKEIYVSEVYTSVLNNYDFLKNVLILHICVLLDNEYKFEDICFNKMNFYFTKKYILENREKIKNDTFQLISVILPLILMEKEYLKENLYRDYELKTCVLESILSKIKTSVKNNKLFLEKQEIELMQYFFDKLVDHIDTILKIGKTNYKVINKKEFNELEIIKEINDKKVI